MKIVDSFKNYFMFSIMDIEDKDKFLNYLKRIKLDFKELSFKEPNMDEISLKVIENDSQV